MLVVMTGLPGTGKSAVAEALARSLRAPVLSVDPIEATLNRLGITRAQRSDVAAYDLAFTLADEQLRLGQSVIIDAVNGMDFVRQSWRDLAASRSVPAVFVLTICSDASIHRSRIEHRARGIDGFLYEPDWTDVRTKYDWYEPFTGDALVLDAVRPLEENVTAALSYVTARRT